MTGERPAEDDEDMERFLGGLPILGSVLLRCAGCGAWKIPEHTDIEVYFNKGGHCYVCGDHACEEWKEKALAYEEQEKKRPILTSEMVTLLEAANQNVNQTNEKPVSPLVTALRLRAADTSKPALRRGVLSILDTYSRPGKGYLKEESIRALQESV